MNKKTFPISMAAAVAVLFLMKLDAHAAPPTPVYFPVAISYMNGDPVNLALAAEPKETIKECLDTLQHLIGAAVQNGNVPDGGAVLGACVPAPAHFSGQK